MGKVLCFYVVGFKTLTEESELLRKWGYARYADHHYRFQSLFRQLKLLLIQFIQTA
jgi:hypothetical protein